MIGQWWTLTQSNCFAFCIIPQWMRPEQKRKLIYRKDKPIKITRKKMAHLKKRNYVRDCEIYL